MGEDERLSDRLARFVAERSVQQPRSGLPGRSQMPQGEDASSADRHLPDMLSERATEDQVLDQVRSHTVPPPVSAVPLPWASGPPCPICNGAGRVCRAVPFGHLDFGKDFACRCLERELREKRKQKMIALCEQFGFQRTQRLSTFRHQIKGVQEAFVEARNMIERLEAWARLRAAARQASDLPPRPAEWLVLLGPIGTGKTHLAMAIANACIDAGLVTLFATVPDLLDHLRAAFAPETETGYDELFEQLKKAEVLILDDLGTQRASDWADEKASQLINYRYNARLPTVITLNGKAWASVDERIRSRLQHTGLVLLVSLEEAQDYRLRGEKDEERMQ